MNTFMTNTSAGWFERRGEPVHNELYSSALAFSSLSLFASIFMIFLLALLARTKKPPPFF